MAKTGSRKWDRDSIRRTLRELYRQGVDLSYSAMARRNQALVSACNFHFGSYRHAVTMAGLDYQQFIKKPWWTKPWVIRLIKQAHRQKQDLSWRAVSHRQDALGHAAIAAARPRLFGSWNAALRAAGLDPDKVSRYHHWDRQAILKTLVEHHRKRRPINSGHMQRAIPGLYGAAIRIFGTYDEALRAAGIDPSTVRQRRQWSREEVVRQMRLFVQKHGRLTSTLMRKHDSGLERAILLYYKDLKTARRTALAGHNGRGVIKTPHPSRLRPAQRLSA